MSSPERFAATKTFAVVLSVIVAIYGFIGWAESEEWFKAVLCLVAQGLAINTAIAARRAFAKDKWGHGFGGLVFAAGFAMWSEQGLHHAWTADGSDISPALTWFLCVSEPILFWFTESVQLAKKPKTAEELADETLTEMRSGPPEKRRAGLRTIVGGLGGAAAVAMIPSHGQAQEPFSNDPVDRGPADKVKRLTKPELKAMEEARVQARMRIAQGATPYRVNKETGVPISTLKRWARAG